MVVQVRYSQMHDAMCGAVDLGDACDGAGGGLGGAGVLLELGGAGLVGGVKEFKRGAVGVAGQLAGVEVHHTNRPGC